VLFSLTSAVLGETLTAQVSQAPKAMSQEHPYYRQCELGTVAADALRTCGNTQLGVIPTGELGGDLTNGDWDQAALREILPQDQPLGIASVTEEEVYGMLEHAVSQVILDDQTEQIREEDSTFAGFLQISGFCFQYDVSAPSGERVNTVTLSDGTELTRQGEERYTLCAPISLLSGSDGYTSLDYTPLGITETEALLSYLIDNPQLPASGEVRISLLGCREAAWYAGWDRRILFVGSLVLIVLAVFSGVKLKNYQSEYKRIQPTKSRDPL
jgi:2',3'-cyclic-nucleotide 2'-phosphodiesterase (5'-nucleotidase family)